VFEIFYRYVANILYEYYRNRSRCCIYCNSDTRTFQATIPNVSSVFLNVRRKCVNLDIPYISHVGYEGFIWMLRMFYNDFSCVFGYFYKCFRRMFQMLHLLHTYVASVASGCLKSRLGCCICCNGWTYMLQASVPNILYVF